MQISENIFDNEQDKTIPNEMKPKSIVLFKTIRFKKLI
jgi:hypothetical protein